MKLIVGIDPGLKGGITLYEDGKLYEVHHMPTYEITKGTGKAKKVKKYVDGYELHKIIRATFAGNLRPTVYIEDVHSMFGMAAQTNFAMGHGLGCVHTAVRVLGLGFYFAPPRTWQKKVWIDDDMVFDEKKCGKRDTKRTSLNAAKRILPDYKWMISKDGLFDAALVGYFGHLIERGK